MKEFSLAEALRYVTAGFVFFGSLYVFDPEKAVAVAGLGEFSVLGLCLAFGALLYPTYRGLFYNLVIPRLQDAFQLSRGRHTYRTFLSERYSCSRRMATDLFLAIRARNALLADAHRAADATIANVHLGYVSALIASGFSIAAMRWSAPGTWLAWALASGIVFAGTFFFEQRFQSDELIRLRQVDAATIDACARNLGIGEPAIAAA